MSHSSNTAPVLAPEPSSSYRGRTVFIDTYGCQMNVLDSELVQGQLESLGYRFVTRSEDAGVVLINTCSVRDLSEHKVWSQLGRLGLAKKAEQSGLVVGVLGCMAEREGPAIAKRMPHVDIVCGPSNLDRLPALLDNAFRNRGTQLALSGHAARRATANPDDADGVESLDLSRSVLGRAGAAQAYVRITRGCNKFCSFCVVPYTRGPEVHRPPESIIAEVQSLARAGALEVTLLGQTVNHYVFHDGGRTTSFADLLYRIHEAVPELPRLRFITSFPRDFGDDALDAMAACKRICQYLHIPAQSGSNRMLQLMNRGYTVEDYLGLIERARSRMPEIRIASDLICGFPSETDEDHQASLQLLERVRFKNCFVFKYSERSGTVASRRLTDDVPEEIKKQRNLELLEAHGVLALQLNQSRMGQSLEVLVEGHSKLRAHGALPRQDARHDASGDTHEAAHGHPELVTLGVGGALAAGPLSASRLRESTIPLNREPHAGPSAGSTDTNLVRLVGRTRGDEIVAFDGPAELVGQIVKVRAVGATALTLLAQLAT